MKIIRTVSEMQDFSRNHRRNNRKTAFIPTMGFLHEGHLSLIDEAKRRADVTVVSIFVNPTQFAPGEDLDKYPRDFERDRKLCELRGVDAIFAPNSEEMYPEPQTTWVTEESLTGILCGKSRPTHFRGVATVVTKLFNAALPDIAVFGEKDYQQACVIRKMTKDLNFPIEIVTCPIVREPDGLAMSSRNKYLSDTERQNALSINKALKTAEQAVYDGENTPSVIAKQINNQITQNGGRIDYVEVLNAETLNPAENFSDKTLIAVAAFFGQTRLIDNIVISGKND